MIPRTVQAMTIGIMAVASTAVADKIDENTHIKLGTAVAVCFTVGSGTWWISSWLRGIRDRLDDLTRRLDNLPCDHCLTIGPKEKKK